jgi:hypothetical protein
MRRRRPHRYGRRAHLRDGLSTPAGALVRHPRRVQGDRPTSQPAWHCADRSALVLAFGVTASIYARLNKLGTTVVTNGLYSSGPTHGVAR